MRSISTSAGTLETLAAALMTLAAMGCGSAKSGDVQRVDGSSIPTMPTPISGRASLSGRVQGSDGNGVPGATVKVAETDATTTTDAEGNYQMTLPSDSTLTVSTQAVGFAPSFRESIVLADQATVSGFDILVLTADTVSRLDALAVPTQATTRGLMAIRLHSLSPQCAMAGAQISIWPPQAATVMYSLPSIDGGLEEPDVATTSVQTGTNIGAWLVGVIPPGNMLQINVTQSGCQQLTGSPSMGGMLFPGLRRVDVQALTQADLFFE